MEHGVRPTRGHRIPSTTAGEEPGGAWRCMLAHERASAPEWRAATIMLACWHAGMLSCVDLTFRRAVARLNSVAGPRRPVVALTAVRIRSIHPDAPEADPHDRNDDPAPAPDEYHHPQPSRDCERIPLLIASASGLLARHNGPERSRAARIPTPL